MLNVAAVPLTALVETGCTLIAGALSVGAAVPPPPPQAASMQTSHAVQIQRHKCCPFVIAASSVARCRSSTDGQVTGE
jgi:hypothetical protein